MASSFCFLDVATLIMCIFMATTHLAVSLNVERKLISATPVEFLSNPPVPMASPFSEISPDIAPLLPSSGGVVPPVSSVPTTIPSNPSKNPDDMLYPIGPDSAALAPSAFSPVSSAVSLTAYLNIAVLLLAVALFRSI